MDQVVEVAGDLVMEGFVGKEEDFEMDVLRDREQMELLEDWGDVVMVAGAGEQQSFVCAGVY